MGEGGEGRERRRGVKDRGEENHTMERKKGRGVV